MQLKSPVGPRTVTAFRRVTIPAALRERAGWEHGAALAVDVPEGDRAAIRIRTSDGTGGLSARARVVTAVGQISLPAAVMSAAGIEVLSRVYFVEVEGASDTVWLLPESRVKMTRRGRSAPAGDVRARRARGERGEKLG